MKNCNLKEFKVKFYSHEFFGENKKASFGKKKKNF